MDITNNAVWNEIQEIALGGATEVHFEWSCEIVLPDTTFTPYKLLSVDVHREYEKTFTDAIMLEILISQGTHDDYLYPSKDQMLVTLFKTPTGEKRTSKGIGSPVARTYRGVLVDKGSEAMETQPTRVQGTVDPKYNDLRRYFIQLVDLASEQLHKQTIGGIYVNMMNHQVIQGALSKASGELLLDRLSSIEGVDVVEGDNLQVRQHTIVPHGTPLIKFPRYVQDECGGVYTTDIGYYLQNGIWYVYPQYHLERFEMEPRNLSVYNVPKNRLPNIERTYLSDGDRVVVIANGDTKHVDMTEQSQLNQGNAVRFCDANRIIGGFRDVNNNKAMASRFDNMQEWSLIDRSNALDQAPMSERRITANPFREASEVAKRMGSVVIATWENADPDLIYPGMPVRYVFVKGSGLDERYGIVISASYFVSLASPGMNTTKYQCTVYLGLYIA